VLCTTLLFLYNYCSINFMYVSLSITNFMCFSITNLLEKFIKHDEVNYQCCDVRYFVFHFSLYMHNLVEKTIWPILAQESLKALGALMFLSLGRKICLIKRVFALCTILILYTKSRP